MLVNLFIYTLDPESDARLSCLGCSIMGTDCNKHIRDVCETKIENIKDSDSSSIQVIHGTQSEEDCLIHRTVFTYRGDGDCIIYTGDRRIGVRVINVY